MWQKYLLPLIAVGTLGFTMYHVVRAQPDHPKRAPLNPPAQSAFEHAVAATGLVEPNTEMISIGSHLPGVVQKVFVKVGDRVQVGDPLFQLDDRQLQAELKVKAANLAAARAEFERREAMPRREELPPMAARVAEARANLLAMQDQYERTQNLHSRRAATDEDLVLRQQAYRVAQRQLERVMAEQVLLKAGAWQPDRDVAWAAVEQAEAQKAATATELERLTVRATVAGAVLQVNVRPGEFVGAPPGQALLMLGNIQPLHIRADIDENDLGRFLPATRARASLRGNAQAKFDLTFVRIEPYVVPKKSLTGENKERVDTRVLQVIYALPPDARGVYVGQQVDVFIEAATSVSDRVAR